MVGFRQTLGSLLRGIGAYGASSRQSTAPGHISRKEAAERGIELLTSNLCPLQCAQYRTFGYFEVTGGDTGKRYRIRHGFQLNIEELDRKGRRVCVLCFLPEGLIPVGDVMLAQKIALELFETDAIRVAHRSPVWDDVLTEDMRVARRYSRLARRNV